MFADTLPKNYPQAVLTMEELPLPSSPQASYGFVGTKSDPVLFGESSSVGPRCPRSLWK